jgi:hypothetical protein
MVSPGPVSDEDLRACTASAWFGEPDRCRWCDKPLPRRRTRWCSTDCADAYRAEHVWSTARPAALDRDGHTCTRCGRGPGANAVLRLLNPRMGPAEWRRFAARHARLYDLWWRWTTFPGLEVHHLEPLWGLRGDGCHHHAANLVTLCDACHLVETIRWRRIRRAFLEAFAVDIGAGDEDLAANPAA